MPAAKDEPLSLLLRSFHLPTMARIASESMAQAQAKNWSHRELLLHLCESEAQERSARLTVRLLKASGLPDGKTLGTLDEAALPERVRRQLPSLLAGDFIERNENILAFGLPKPPTYCPSGRCCSYKGHYALTVFVLRELFSHGAMAEASLDLRAM